MQFKLDPEKKKVEILGLTPSSIGAVPAKSFDSLLARVEGLTAQTIGAEPKGGSPELNQLISSLGERILSLEQEVISLKALNGRILSLEQQAASLQKQVNTILNPFKEFYFNAITIKAGMQIGAADYRASKIELYVKDVNWHNGGSQVTSPEGDGVKHTWSPYPSVNTNSIFVYQVTTQLIPVVGKPTEPQVINGLDPTKPIYIAVNDGVSTYANNTGGFTVGYR